ncbi:hypothetical protein A9Q79_01930 [Methylophaga sp. 42_25_T18]|nr:hypothetical protein A9Q79_01930 [Methylophaga sp. 42_25_T18]OUR88813.1 hypothetical protein A9Q92_02385 [Methylophaga sp. 42_8_T64]
MKMNKLSALCLAGTMLTASSMAMAWESENGSHAVDFGVTLANDYIWRGYSQTNRAPAVSGSADYSHSSGLYVGTWASNVDFDDDADYEIDIYAGFASEFGESGIGYDLGVLRYLYPGEDYEWNEVYASLSYSYFGVSVAHSGAVYDNKDKDGTYYSASFDYDLPWYELGFSAGIGYYDYDSGVVNVKSAEHTDWRIGLSKSYNTLDLGLTYTGMDSDAEDDIGKNASDKLTISVSTSF